MYDFFLFLDCKHNLIRENIDSEPGVSWTIPSVLNLGNPQIQPRKYLYVFFQTYRGIMSW